MKSVLMATIVAAFLVGCGEEAQKEAVQEEAPFAIKPGKNFTIPDLNLDMIWVEPGIFTMGSHRYETERNVTLTEGFWLGKYEVTQAQWERVMEGEEQIVKRIVNGRPKALMDVNPSYFLGPNRPVDSLRHDEALKFCKKLTEIEQKAGRIPQDMAYQLPTMDHWEYACRAGTTTVYWWGDDINSTRANLKRSGFSQTRDVGQYAANPWGFHDMVGNVEEWCADEAPDKVNQTWAIRGGSYNHDESSLRGWWVGGWERRVTFGFRISFRSK